MINGFWKEFERGPFIQYAISSARRLEREERREKKKGGKKTELNE